MESQTLFLAFLVTWGISLLITHTWGWRKRLPLRYVVASHAAPSAAAIVMTYVFLIAGGTTVAQFAAGSESGKDLWSLWFHLWPILLFASAVAGIINLVWTVVACVKKQHRRWIPVPVAGLVMSVLAFITVGANFPDA